MGVRCRVPPTSGTCPPVSVLKRINVGYRFILAVAPGGGRRALLSVLSTSSRGWLRLHEKGGRRHDVPAHHRAERHRPLRTGRRGVRAHQPRRLDYRRDAGIR